MWFNTWALTHSRHCSRCCGYSSERKQPQMSCSSHSEGNWIQTHSLSLLGDGGHGDSYSSRPEEEERVQKLHFKIGSTVGTLPMVVFGPRCNRGRASHPEGSRDRKPPRRSRFWGASSQGAISMNKGWQQEIGYEVRAGRGDYIRHGALWTKLKYFDLKNLDASHLVDLMLSSWF